MKSTAKGAGKAVVKAQMMKAPPKANVKALAKPQGPAPKGALKKVAGKGKQG